MNKIHDVLAETPGTFYARESPSSPLLAPVGARVASGDSVGVVEVMKMFTPLTAGVDGTVQEVLVEDGDPVDVGQVVLRIMGE